MADISKQLEELLLSLRSRHGKEENLKIDSIPTSPQLPESRDVNRPEPKPSYVINATPNVTKASLPFSNRTIKRHQRISFEEIDKRRLTGLCLFCEEPETPDHYLRHKNLRILTIDCDEDQSCDDEELVEMEVATESIETEHGTVKREANASMILANLEDESMPPFQVPVSDSKILRNVEKIEVEGDVERGQKVQSMEKIYSAHQVFGKMSRQETLGIKKKRKGFKSWRFKFKQRKQQRGKLRSTHQLIHRGNVMYKYLCSSAKVALMKKNKFSITWPTLKDDGFMEDDHVYQEGLPLWLLVGFKFWKFKFINRKLQKMMREHKFASHVKLMYDKGEPDELFIMAKAVSMRFLLGVVFGITENNADQGQQAVFEQILLVNEWLQTSLVTQQVMRSKKIKFPKRWMFKYKYVEEDIKSLHNQLSYMSRLELEERFKSWSQRETVEAKQNLKNWYGGSLLEFLKRIEAGSSMIMVPYNNTELINYLKHLVKRCLVPIIKIEDALIEVRPPELFVADRMVATKEKVEKDMEEDDQKQQGDWSHYFLLFAAANQSHLWSASYQVWHRWKARCLFVGMISTMWAWLFGEEGFDTGKETRRVAHEIEVGLATRGGWRLKVDLRLRSFGSQNYEEEALNGRKEEITDIHENC